MVKVGEGLWFRPLLAIQWALHAEHGVSLAESPLPAANYHLNHWQQSKDWRDWLVVPGQYREAATDLQYAVSLLREIYTTQLVPYRLRQRHHQQEDAASSSVSEEDHGDEVVVATVGSLIDTVALIGDELAERTRVVAPTWPTGQRNLSAVAENVSAALLQRQTAKRYSHANDLFQAAHIFHLCSIIVLGIFVVEV